MIDRFCRDIWTLVFSQSLTTREYSAVALVSKSIRALVSEDDTAKSIAASIMGDTFWKLADRYAFSPPLDLWRGELFRIERFQQSLEMNGMQRWNAQDFIRLWKTCAKQRARGF